MKRLVLLAALLALPLSCGTTRQTIVDDVIPPAVDVAADCTKGAVHDTAVVLLDDVASALADNNWIGLLKDLVARFTGSAVDCAVRHVAGESYHAAMVSGDQTQSMKAARGKQWLEARGVSQ